MPFRHSTVDMMDYQRWVRLTLVTVSLSAFLGLVASAPTGDNIGINTTGTNRTAEDSLAPTTFPLQNSSPIEGADVNTTDDSGDTDAKDMNLKKYVGFGGAGVELVKVGLDDRADVGGGVEVGGSLQVGAGAGIGYNPKDKNVGVELLTPVGEFAANFGCLNRICFIACVSIKVC